MLLLERLDGRDRARPEVGRGDAVVGADPDQIVLDRAARGRRHGRIGGRHRLGLRGLGGLRRLREGRQRSEDAKQDGAGKSHGDPPRYGAEGTGPVSRRNRTRTTLR
jgi:hypothetical protein